MNNDAGGVIQSPCSDGEACFSHFVHLNVKHSEAVKIPSHYGQSRVDLLHLTVQPTRHAAFGTNNVLVRRNHTEHKRWKVGALEETIFMRHLLASTWAHRDRPPSERQSAIDTGGPQNQYNENKSLNDNTPGRLMMYRTYNDANTLVNYNRDDARYPRTPPSNLIRNRMTVSSVPSHFGARDVEQAMDKKALKKEKRREKEEKKRREKEEKNRQKEGKKPGANNTMPRNWNYNVHPLSDHPEFVRPSLVLRAVPIDFGPVPEQPTHTQQFNSLVDQSSLHPATTDLLRVKQVYGTTTRRPVTQLSNRFENYRGVYVCRP